MMLTPWGPSAVPTGGAGLAAAAGTCSFTNAATFLPPPFPAGLAGPFAGAAMLDSSRSLEARSSLATTLPRGWGYQTVLTRPCHHPTSDRLVRLELQVIQLHARRPPEQAHADANLALV